MTGGTFLESLAVYIAWRDGQGHGLNAQLAILFCIRNRVAAKWHGGDLGKILESELDTITYKGLPDVRDPDFTQLSGLAEAVFDNTAQDRLSCGALYWGNQTDDDNLGGYKERIAQVGTLILWK